MAGFRDVVILLPGITGSVLANKAGKEVWAPSAGAVWRAVTSIGRSIEGLVKRHPEVQPLVAKVTGLYSDIVAKGLENESKAPGR